MLFIFGRLLIFTVALAMLGGPARADKVRRTDPAEEAANRAAHKAGGVEVRRLLGVPKRSGSFRDPPPPIDTSGLDAADVEAALSVAGPWWGDELVGDLLAWLASEAGDHREALRLYGLYFDFYPFGRLEWHLRRTRWAEVAEALVGARVAAAEAAFGWRGRRRAAEADAKAVHLYRKLVDLCERGGPPQEREQLAAQIVAQFPQSIFCPAAMLSAGHAVEQLRPSTYAGGAPELYVDLLKKMEQAGAPERARVVVLLAAKRFEEFGRRMTIRAEKRLALLEQAMILVRSGDPAAGRELCQRFLDTYPEATLPEIKQAWAGLAGPGYAGAHEGDAAHTQNTGGRRGGWSAVRSVAAAAMALGAGAIGLWCAARYDRKRRQAQSVARPQSEV